MEGWWAAWKACGHVVRLWFGKYQRAAKPFKRSYEKYVTEFESNIILGKSEYIIFVDVFGEPFLSLDVTENSFYLFFNKISYNWVIKPIHQDHLVVLKNSFPYGRKKNVNFGGVRIYF